MKRARREEILLAVRARFGASTVVVGRVDEAPRSYRVEALHRGRVVEWAEAGTRDGAWEALFAKLRGERPFAPANEL